MYNFFLNTKMQELKKLTMNVLNAEFATNDAMGALISDVSAKPNAREAAVRRVLAAINKESRVRMLLKKKRESVSVARKTGAKTKKKTDKN